MDVNEGKINRPTSIKKGQIRQKGQEQSELYSFKLLLLIIKLNHYISFNTKKLHALKRQQPKHVNK